MLRDAFLMNQDLYTKKLEEAYANHSSSTKKKATKTPNENRGNQDREPARQNKNRNSTITGHQSFYQKPEGEKAVAGADGNTNPKVKCYKCSKWGHYASNCPTANNGEQHFRNNDDETNTDGIESEPELTDDEGNNAPKVSFQHMMVAFMGNESLHANCTQSILLDT